MGYSATVLDHFHHPRNVGDLDGAQGFAREENPVCGDVVEMWIGLNADMVREVRFRVFGCVAAVAACSFLSEWARGRNLSDAVRLKAPELIDWLGGLPPGKRHGAAMAVAAFKKALDSCQP